ncbi:glycosyltransferase family 2 protein [Modicisalibacter radicis]|uniref:glycosyltransferase n=1 Tax=Halomonas sp. EAR18 TaxID=2518972 RepID=UPI00109BF95D|nr:glycosyltransferase [Halomonas sp. EAR18]
MIGVVIPAHNEEACLESCLEALVQAIDHPGLGGERVNVVVVLDACRDGSAAIARRYPVTVLEVAGPNVGMARHAGAQWLLARGARWLAFTDADSRVSDDWLVSQCHVGSDVVCGGIRLAGWERLPVALRQSYLAHDHGDRRIYGANLGVCALAYQAVGGFKPLRCHEDVQLVHALEAGGYRIAWDRTARVTTSAREDARAPEGFGALMKALR